MCSGDHRIELTMGQFFQHDESLGGITTLRASVIRHRRGETGFHVPADENRVRVRILLQDAGQSLSERVDALVQLEAAKKQ